NRSALHRPDDGPPLLDRRLETDSRFHALAHQLRDRAAATNGLGDQQVPPGSLPRRAGFISGDDQAFAVRGRARARWAGRAAVTHRPRQEAVPFRLSIREDARLVLAADVRTPADH